MRGYSFYYVNSRKQLALWGYDTESFEKQYTGKKMTLTAEDGYTIPMIAYYPHDEVDNHTVILVHGLGVNYSWRFKKWLLYQH